MGGKQARKNYTQRNISTEWAFLLNRAFENMFI